MEYGSAATEQLDSGTFTIIIFAMKKIFLAFLILCHLLHGCDSSKPEEKDSLAGKEEVIEQPINTGLSVVKDNSSEITEQRHEDELQKTEDNIEEKTRSIAVSGEGTSGDVLPDPAEIRRADAILAFANRARDTFAKGWYAVPDALNHGTQFYSKTWHLPGHAIIPPKKRERQNLVPSPGLFDESEMKIMTKALDDMDKAVENVISSFTELEKYVEDDSIRDNGKRGNFLARQVGLRHAAFLAARKTWLEVVEKRAQEAELTLLHANPLERQILNGQRILAQAREVALMLRSGSPSRSELSSLRNNMQEILEKAQQPPFMAIPDLERLYRGFLKDVVQYLTILQRGIDEGFYNTQKKELNMASVKCLKAYNEFAKAASLRAARIR